MGAVAGRTAGAARPATPPVRQYEIWRARLPEPAGSRPVLLLSRDAAYAYLSRVLAVEITATIRDIPVELPLGRAEGLARRSVANFDNLRAIPKAWLETRLGHLSSSRLPEVRRALGFALGWPELKG
jgi:mRNA interferase MazF